MNHLTAAYIQKAFSSAEIIDIVKKGILKYSAGNYTVPERTHIKRGKSTNLIMPAFGERYYCTKLISVDPDNHQLDLPVISGILVLNDAKTGNTLTTMDAPMITALRTAAVGSIGLDLISDSEIKSLGIIGLGVQGLWQTIFAASIRNFNTVFCYSRSKSKFLNYKNEIANRFPALKIIWCDNSEKVVQQSDVIISCTTSSNPVFDVSNINFSEKRFISVGSFSKQMQELPDEIYKVSEALIIDSKTAKTEVGDVINTIKNQWIDNSDILELSDVLNGIKTIDRYKKIVFKSVGMAAFDLALAAAVYTQSQTNTN